ncbi:MAG: UDP-N-acetylglucosamine--N-acetylmuramyl-(pentapeptide) pyrophosphoryl-undecaprenol N-acetylglucosamine transferase [Candidatus Pacebacteria bacterium]|nr:UDP-N-acetylglucosamine--N-acetylmuramyl-(pentapeptide) pyrophosphoryl-undecaprenol N-acetylglucosamine transferase [Candidatus Paceibacterota bacterium]
MKIIFTGGGSGGHFYPIIAVAQEINNLVIEKKLLKPKMYFLSNSPYDKKKLFENNIEFKKISAGKLRRHFSILNFFGLFKTAWGFLKSIFIVFNIFPDVIFSNGGNVAFPVLLSARILRIPVFIHISDSVPGRTNRWASKFAQRISLGFPDAIQYLESEKDKVAFLGNPVQKEITIPLKEGAETFLKLKADIPTILVLGGSSGAKSINENLIDILPELVKKYQIIHQTGKKLFKDTQKRASVVLYNNEFEERYKAFPYLKTLAMRMSAGITNLIISRAGAGSISEIAIWGKPSIIIPIPEAVSGDQRKNAFSYARAGACVVIEQENLSPELFLTEINRLMDDSVKMKDLSEKAKEFSIENSAHKIATELLNIIIEHESH